ncbi:alpha-hydroxy acid oxidase [Nocardioides sp.]|uniref:alpha-hydroxy acid oxidase n=1 Tax=Nocardioides sp. TaxID=35761 RepID=UPI0026271521|nr:alpha-hydroxy acid oxidase [Nocardioides sp.]
MLPAAVYDVVDGAAEREVTAARNVDAFGELVWRQPVGVAVDTVDTRTTLFGRTLAAPLLTAPCGLVGASHPDAEPGVFRAAAERGLGAVLSTTATRSLEQVAREGGHPHGWFQCYFAGGRAGAEQLLARARSAGYEGLVLTLDTPVAGVRHRDARHGLSLPMTYSPAAMARLAPQVLARPRWAARVARHPSTLGIGNRVHGLPDGGMGTLFDQPPTWADLAWIREAWDGPILVKGITLPDDAYRAVAAGADGVIVSNHGGRQLDGAPATLRALPVIRSVVAGAVPVLFDGGIRSGADIARAIALGADAVLVGRPYLYGVAVAGEYGAARVLDLLCCELEQTMRLLGAPDLAALREVPIGWGARYDDTTMDEEWWR